MDWSLPPAQHISLGTVSADALALSGRAVLMGWSIRESTAAATADCQILDGVTAGGDPVADVPLNAHEGTREWFGPMGIALYGGLFLHRLAGSLSVAFFVIMDDQLDPVLRDAIFYGRSG